MKEGVFVLKRRIDDYLVNWKNNRKQALLITGARQVGKTYSINQFAINNFESVVRIDFSVRTDLIDLFAQLKNSQQLIINLSANFGQDMHPGKTLIFMDEIQLVYKRREELRKNGLLDPNSQDILTASKALVISGEYRYIFSGSLLGVSVNDVVLHPVGYLDEIQMYPLDFEEYLWNKGVGKEAIEYVRNCFKDRTPVDEPINKLFLDYFKEYVLIGGMPEAVSAFFETNNLHQVQTTHEQIIKGYLLDITTYIADESKKIRVRDIFNNIPSELNNKNKKYIASHVLDKNYLKRNTLEDEFIWISSAAIAIPVYNITEPIIPLFLSKERKTLKLFLNDIGLLDTMLLSTGIRQKLLLNEKEINYGAPYENVVAQELYSHGFKDKLFYYNSKKHGEIDFVIEYENDVLPIEVKSGKTNDMNIYNHTALNNAIKLYDIQNAFVLGQCNVVKETEVITQLPVYMISFIRNQTS